MAKKQYYAYIIDELVDYFDERLAERKDKIKVLSISRAVSNEGTPCIRYILEAEEGVIAPQWELK